MPFMHGTMPLRRTFYFLQQGKIKFRDNVSYHNPSVQLVKHVDTVITPFAKAYLDDGREVLFDLEGLNREEIEVQLAKTLGKTELVRKRESLEAIAKVNPADFGSKCQRQCMCEVQGQHPCTGLLYAPKHLTGKHRWNHNLI